MKWLDVVKKHAKLNPGKSLKEYLGDAQKEYASLKKQGKIDPPKNGSQKKGNKKHKKSKKQRGGQDLMDVANDEGGEGAMDIVEDEEEGIIDDVPNHLVEGGKKGRRSKNGGDFAPSESATKLGSAPVGGGKRRRSKKGGEFAPSESATKLGSAPVGGGKRRRRHTKKGGKSRHSKSRRSRSRRSRK